MFIVGFTGASATGKDTAGLALVRQLGFERFAFAEPIKEAINAMLGFKPSNWLDRDWKEGPLGTRVPSPRILAQTLGTEWGRDTIDPDFWVGVTEHRIRNSSATRVVITDVRFDNEARWIQSQGGWVIELLRESANPVANHVSEHGIDRRLIDFTITNNKNNVKAFQDIVVREINDKLLVANAL